MSHLSVSCCIGVQDAAALKRIFGVAKMQAFRTGASCITMEHSAKAGERGAREEG